MEGLAKDHAVTLFSFYSDKRQLDYIENAKGICREVHLQFRPERYALANLFKGLILPKPFSIYNYWSAQTFTKLKQIADSTKIDVIQIEHTALAPYARLLDCPFKIIDFHNLEHEKMERYARFQTNILKRTYAQFTTYKLKRYEFQLVKQFDLCLTCSERERRILSHYAPKANLAVIPNGTDIRYDKGKTAVSLRPVRNLLFVGALNAEKNVDAVLYFYHNIFPLVLKVYPNITLKIAGGAVPPRIQKLADEPNVDVLGFVEDLTTVLRPDTIAIVPLRYGGGTRLKITEAMAHAVPVVSTSIGCEGLTVEDKKNISIADTPETFSEACLNLIESDTFRRQIISNGLELVRKHYDWKAIANDLSGRITQMVASN